MGIDKEITRLVYDTNCESFVKVKMNMLVLEGVMWDKNISVPSLVPLPYLSAVPVMPGKNYKFGYMVFIRERLFSDWRVGSIVKDGLNRSLRNPVFRGWVDSFVWVPESRGSQYKKPLVSIVESGKDDDAVVQLPLRMRGFAWSAKVKTVFPYLNEVEVKNIEEAGVGYEFIRKGLEHVCYEIDDNVMLRIKPSLFKEQGDLKVYKVERPWKPGIVWWHKGLLRNPTVFDHFIPKAELVARFHNVYLVYVPERTMVLSEGSESLTIDEGWYIMNHPSVYSSTDASDYDGDDLIV